VNAVADPHDKPERRGFRAWLKNAFAMEGYQEPLSEREMELLDRIAKAVVRRGMTVPTLLFLEIGKPLNYISSQAMAFFEPIVRSLFTATEYGEVRRILERRHSIETLMGLIETASNEGREKLLNEKKTEGETD